MNLQALYDLGVAEAASGQDVAALPRRAYLTVGKP
jgi:hypothetical protein